MSNPFINVRVWQWPVALVSYEHHGGQYEKVLAFRLPWRYELRATAPIQVDFADKVMLLDDDKSSIVKYFEGLPAPGEVEWMVDPISEKFNGEAETPRGTE